MQGLKLYVMELDNPVGTTKTQARRHAEAKLLSNSKARGCSDVTNQDV